MNQKTHVVVASALLGMLMIPAELAHARGDVHCYFTWPDNARLNVKSGSVYVTKSVRTREFNRLVEMGQVVARVAADGGAHCQLNHPENTLIDTRIEKMDYRLSTSGRIPHCADLNAMVECCGGRCLDADNEADEAGPGPSPSTSTRPNIIVSEFSLNPATPVRGRTVAVRIGVYNNGGAAAGPYRVEWYPGENYPEPACSWNVPGNNARGGRILNCTYAGYPSSYGRIRTKVIADSENQVTESNEGDNTRLMQIRVAH